MRPLLNPEEMAAADQAAIDAGTPVEVLMDRAGRAVARAAIDMMGGRYGKKVVVVCGKGNNGGDGYAAARVLRREGLGVRCLAVIDPAELKGAARTHHERAVAAGVRIEPFDQFTRERLERVDLIVDAIFGTGFHGPVEGAAAGAIAAIAEAEVPVLAVDIPSGINGERGVISSLHVNADRTVAMGCEKIGTFLSPPEAVGDVEVAGIGIYFEVEPSRTAMVVEAADVAGWMPEMRAESHKRSRGTVAILTGADEMTGAAALVVRGAMRAGCGYVMLGCTQRVANIVQESCPEAIVYVVSESDHLGPDAYDAFRPALEQATAVAIGPGLGRGDDQKKLVERVLQETDQPVVLDADGLNVLAGMTEVVSNRATRLAITPHPAELARLLDKTTDEIGADRLGSARTAAATLGCEVLLKGYRSIITRPDGSTWFNPTGGPSLATAGTGDVLTGVVAAFLAAANDHALEVATYVHGLAGDLARDSGAVAWDVAEALPDAIEIVLA